MLIMLALTPIVMRPIAAIAQTPRLAKFAVVRTLADTSALATITRSPGANSQATILLRERDANPETLASAMVALFDSRQRDGEEPTRRIVITLRGHKSAEALTPNERQLGELYLARLRDAQLERIDGVGLTRATSIALGPARPHAGK
jgi:hypothetical protein